MTAFDDYLVYKKHVSTQKPLDKLVADRVSSKLAAERAWGSFKKAHSGRSGGNSLFSDGATIKGLPLANVSIPNVKTGQSKSTFVTHTIVD